MFDKPEISNATVFDDLACDAELHAFAEDLLDAHEVPEIAPNFAAEVASELTPVWSFKDAVRRNGLVRAAAMLLISLTASVPVLAIVAMIANDRVEKPTIGFLPPLPHPEIVNPVAPDPELVLPSSNEMEELLDPDWVSQIEKSNQRKQLDYMLEAPLMALGLSQPRLLVLSSIWMTKTN